jgi:putative DNA primase/helicase
MKVPGTRAPLFERFLAEITNEKLDLMIPEDQRLSRFFQRMFGYMLTGSTSEHALFFGYGAGANGKTVCVNTLRCVMGDYAIAAPSDVFLASKNERHPTELADLRGARLVVASEIDKGQHWNESRLKALTGGDPVKARFMRQDFFQFTPIFKPLMMGNHRPSLHGVDEAIRRRMYLLPFEVVIDKGKRDKRLTEKLQEEGPAILRWAIDGCLEWQRTGLKPPERVVEATNDYLNEQDVFEQWLDERCIRDVNAQELSGGLFAEWRWWAGERGEVVGSQKAFAAVLTDRGFKHKRTNVGGAFLGLKLRRPPTPEPPPPDQVPDDGQEPDE